jgi:UDP-3-O-[3-hydroxymyristoyl] glucosamine N-acyltransferase
VSLGRNVVVEDGCIIEEGVVIEHNAVIHSGSSIGACTRIRANAAIGGDGFGFERDGSGEPIRFPHLGGVSIGRHVEVGSGACIARGALNDTVIEDYVKIDNLVQVAHNCHVEWGVMLASGANLCGGVRIGRGAWIGPQASVIQNVEVGEGALVGMGAVVVRAVPANCVYAGNPARLLRRTDGKS